MLKSEFVSMLAGRTQETINKLASDIGLTQLLEGASEQLKALPLWDPDFFSQGSGLHGLDTFIIQAILIPKAIIVGILGIVIFSIFFIFPWIWLPDTCLEKYKIQIKNDHHDSLDLHYSWPHLASTIF